MRYFAHKQIIVPVGLIVRNRKMFLNKRRDTRPEFNNKWEFPGGGVDNGETVEAALVRELKEETGFNVQIVDRLPDILTISQKNTSFPYQVFLVTHICTITSGSLKTAPAESAGSGWFTIAEAKKMDMLPLNKKCFQGENLKILTKYID
jgi:8-oxo-dGTP diphosphatase